MKKLFVGNLPYSATEGSIQDLFSQVGAVESARLIVDKSTGRSKGFGFVEFQNDADADRAIAEFNGKEFEGRPITVNEARPMAPRSGGGFGGGGGRPRRGGFGGGRGGYRGDRGGGHHGSGDRDF